MLKKESRRSLAYIFFNQRSEFSIKETKDIDFVTNLQSGPILHGVKRLTPFFVGKTNSVIFLLSLLFNDKKLVVVNYCFEQSFRKMICKDKPETPEIETIIGKNLQCMLCDLKCTIQSLNFKLCFKCRHKAHIKCVWRSERF